MLSFFEKIRRMEMTALGTSLLIRRIRQRNLLLLLILRRIQRIKKRKIKEYNVESVRDIGTYNLSVPTLSTKQSRAMDASWSDSENEENSNEDDGESNHASNFLAFMAKSQVASEQMSENEDSNFVDTKIDD